MKKNYLKPLCKKVPIRGSRLMQTSYDKGEGKAAKEDGGWARENSLPQSNSVWDD